MAEISDWDWERREIARRNAAFLKRLREMSDADLAAHLEAVGTFVAPNPHYVLEAARRLRCVDERIRDAVLEAMCRRRAGVDAPG